MKVSTNNNHVLLCFALCADSLNNKRHGMCLKPFRQLYIWHLRIFQAKRTLAYLAIEVYMIFVVLAWTMMSA